MAAAAAGAWCTLLTGASWPGPGVATPYGKPPKYYSLCGSYGANQAHHQNNSILLGGCKRSRHGWPTPPLGLCATRVLGFTCLRLSLAPLDGAGVRARGMLLFTERDARRAEMNPFFSRALSCSSKRQDASD